jgi:hypothetical protein
MHVWQHGLESFNRQPSLAQNNKLRSETIMRVRNFIDKIISKLTVSVNTETILNESKLTTFIAFV